MSRCDGAVEPHDSDSPVTFDLVVSLGDPRGIGAEVAHEAARRVLSDHGDARLLMVGADNRSSTLEGVSTEVVGQFDGTELSAGSIAIQSIEVGVQACVEGRARALVTAPIHKPAFQAAGAHFPGHTEFLCHLTGVDSVGMLMSAEETSIGGPLRVLLATTHLPLRAVPDSVTQALLEEQGLLLVHELTARWGLARPRIALCAINPHASDEGLFGNEEADVLAPAVAALQDAGCDVSGPISADTVFSRALRGEFDAVIAPYHDVGMAAFKTVSFGRGVNVTLGLPFVRTSPDHGTAFDLVGTGLADATSMEQAMRLALRLSRVHLSERPPRPVGPAAQRA